MKQSLILFGIMSIFALNFSAQDIIMESTGQEIKAKIIEVNLNDIKYKKFNNSNGPVYTILKSSVFMIKYENGEREMFTKDNYTSQSTSINERVPNLIVESADIDSGPDRNMSMYFDFGIIDGRDAPNAMSFIEGFFVNTNNFKLGLRQGIGKRGYNLWSSSWQETRTSTTHMVLAIGGGVVFYETSIGIESTHLESNYFGDLLHFISVSSINSLRVQAGAFLGKVNVGLIYDLDEIIIHPSLSIGFAM